MPIQENLLSRISANDSSLTDLDLSYQNLTNEDIEKLVVCLRKNSYLEKLNLSGNSLSSRSLELVTHKDISIVELNVSHCCLRIINPLRENTHLKHLELNSNELDDDSAQNLVESHLHKLFIAGNSFSDAGAALISTNTTIKYLSISHNKINIAGAIALAQNQTITTLIINYNNIEYNGAKALGSNLNFIHLGLSGNNIKWPNPNPPIFGNSLKCLDISYNVMENNDLTCISETNEIIDLDIRYNRIYADNVKILLKFPLKKLVISHNNLGDEGAEYISMHPSIYYLDMAGNNITFRGAYPLSKNKILTTLILSSNKLMDAGGMTIAQSTSIKELYLSECEIYDAAAYSLSDNNSIEILNLNYNHISAKGRKKLKENQRFKQLIISAEQPPEYTSDNLDNTFLLSDSFLCISGSDNSFHSINPAFSRVLGYSLDDMLGHSIQKYLHPDDKEPTLKLLSSKDNLKKYTNRYVGKDRSIRTIRWVSHLLHNRHYSVGVDVTLEKDSEFKLKAYAEKLVKETFDNNQRNREFISHLSHEIRNPLSSILRLTELCVEHVDRIEKVLKNNTYLLSSSLTKEVPESIGEIREFLGIISACGDHQKAVLDENLDIIKITENKYELDNKPFNLKKELNDIFKILKVNINKKLITVNLFIEPNQELWVIGDKLRFKKIIINVLSNAIKFTKHGKIDIKLKPLKIINEKIKIDIDITDTGIGISESEIKQLFQRFSQANSNMGSQYGGSGLGLHLSQEIANLMNGSIMVSSQKGVGSTFTISVEMQQLDKTYQLEKVSSQVSQTGLFRKNQPTHTPRNILIAEDNAVNQKVLIRLLKKYGHHCSIANNGEEAVALNKEFVFDVILMDIQMPIMNGLDATKMIRLREQENGIKRIPIYAITANALEDEIKAGYDAGIDFYLSKPYTTPELLDKINSLSTANRVLSPKFSELKLSKALSASL